MHSTQIYEKIQQFRPGHIVAGDMEGQLGQSASDGDNDSFASADDIGVLNVAFDDAIDNLTRFDYFLTSFVLLNVCNVSFAALPMTTSQTDQ